MNTEKDIKFLTDINLGRLAVWMRILGFDSVCYRGTADRTFLRKAQKENRIVLTRKRDLVNRQFQGILLLIENDRVDRQVEEVFGTLGLELLPDQYFSRCLKCNMLLDEIEKGDIQDRVPPYVFEHHSKFMICRGCKAVYWSGTHSKNIRNRIKALHIPFRRL